MCFRLFAHVAGAKVHQLAEWGRREGLDVTPSDRAPAGREIPGGYLHVAWGDCACSLVTRREGRLRLLQWVELACESSASIQLLLMSDDGPDLRPGPVGTIPLSQLRGEGLGGLQEGRVTQVLRDSR